MQNVCLDDLKQIKIKNIHRIVIGQININSLRNKFDLLSNMISGNIDILLVTETKLDNSFPEAQFQIKGYANPYRLDRNGNGGGILLYVREDIPTKLLKNTSFNNNKLEAIFVEINLRKKKWLLSCSYNPHKSEISNHLNEIGKHFDSYSSKYENYLIMGDFNAEPSEHAMANFMQTYSLRNLIKGPTCFKNPEKPSCIDLIMTNRSKSFQGSYLI